MFTGVSSAEITEYNFENNSLGAWIPYNTGGYYGTPSLTVSSAYAYNSDYGLRVNYHKTGFDLNSMAGIKTNMTGDNYIDFDYNILSSWSHIMLRHNGALIWTTLRGDYKTQGQGVWQHAHIWIPATQEEETVHVGFGSFEFGPPNPKSGNLDNFESDGFPVPFTTNDTISDYTVIITSSQNTILQAINTSFGDLLSGSTNYLTPAFNLTNIGNVNTTVETVFTSSYSGTYGFVNESNVMGGSNFSLQMNGGTYDTLSNTDSLTTLTDNVLGDNTPYDWNAKLLVPAGQTSLIYNGIIELTFSNE